MSAVKVKFSVGTGVYTWQIPAGTEFKSGEEYTYTISISRTDITFTGTINPWTTRTGGTRMAN